MTTESHASRRQFLRECAPAALAAVMPGLAMSPSRAAAAQPSAPPGDLLRVSRRAMGCRFQVMLPAAGAKLDAAREALDLVDDLERQMSIFREDSELSRINRAAAAGPVQVEPGLFGLLQAAARLSEETGGAFDITAGPVSRLRRECLERGEPPRSDEIRAALARTGMRHVRLDADEQTVEFTRPGMDLDLSGIGKGYALDRVAELLASRGADVVLVHGGHSSVRAAGRPPWDEAWTVAVRHPLDPGRAVATVRLRDRALGTSALGEQCVANDGSRLGHLLDPRTGGPARGALLASVLAPGAAQADALATAFCVMAPEETRAYCDRHPEVGALLVETAGDGVRPIVVGATDEVEVRR